MALENTLAVALQESDQGLEAAGGGLTVPCKVASVVWEDAQKRYERLSNIIMVLVGLALLTILAAVILFFAVDEAEATALVTFVAGLLEGVPAAFVKGERDKAETARNAAHAIVNQQCQDQTAEQVVQAITP